ncbi:MAG: LicD family protein [Butyrivibrio sp.]|nr:LicD family protein [Butyrivibrio sp.]
MEGHYTLSDIDTRKIQKVLLMMMDDIHALCAANGLCYVITGGCAIGAVRHKGFIPWDDDIDVSMPRADYDRFAALVKKAFPDKYDVQEIRIDKSYDLNFMKLRLKGTRFLEASDTDADRAGIFIDIFPIENVYDGALAQAWQGIKSDGLQFVCSCVRIRKKLGRLGAVMRDNAALSRTLKLKAFIGALFGFKSLREWLLLTERALSRCKDGESRRIAIPVGRGHFKGERYPRSWFFEPVQREFEDRKYFFPAQTKRYLRKLYGDYAAPPPESERERHGVLEFDLGKYEAL